MTPAGLSGSIAAMVPTRCRPGEVVRRRDDRRWNDLVCKHREMSALQVEIDEGDALLRTREDGAPHAEFRRRRSWPRADVAGLRAGCMVLRARDEGRADYPAAVARLQQSGKECIDWLLRMLDRVALSRGPR